MSIESAIMQALELIDPEVIQIPYDGDRPTGDYMGFQPIGIDMQRAAAKKRTDNGDGTFTQENFYQAVLMVSINAYGEKGYNRLVQVHGLKEDYRARGIFTLENMALVHVGSPRNLSALGDEAYRTRWQSDALFHLRVETSFMDYQLKRFIVTGEWVSGDDIITLTSDSALGVPR